MSHVTSFPNTSPRVKKLSRPPHALRTRELIAKTARPALSRRRIAICAAALMLLPGCQNVPKYKRANGRFADWCDYEGKDFKPDHGIDTAVNLAAQTITVVQGDDTNDFIVTPDTRLYHNGDDITLADLPPNQTIKFTLADDRKHLVTVWYGTHSNASVGPAGSARGK